MRALGTVWRNSPSAYFGCGARTQAHFDLLENLFCVVAGAKQVMLWHPAQGAAVLYPGSDGDACKSQADIFQPDLVRFPLLAEAQASALHVEVKAGDALYIPVGWWHAVSTPPFERSISVSYWAQQPEGKAWEPDAWPDADVEVEGMVEGAEAARDEPVGDALYGSDGLVRLGTVMGTEDGNSRVEFAVGR